MTTVTFINHKGEATSIQAEAGISLMQAAVNNSVAGIIAECGGACSCATCHCYVDDAWLSRISPPSQVEKDMLECVLNPQPNSRLSCQITVSADMDGLTVRVPENQY
jgi:ferredoxin, 2Fe-2S